MNNQKLYNKILDIIYKTDINVTLYKNRILSKNFLNNKELKSIYLHIIEQCNLNCAYCDNFSPLAKDNWYISIEQFENNIKRLKLFFNNIAFINIGGGEPLLHPYIIEICYILRNYYPYSNINLLTNGLLLEKEYDDKNFILCIDKLNIGLCVSEYPINLNYDKLKHMYKKSYIQLKRDTMHIVRISLHKISNSKIYYNCAYSGLRNNHVYRPRCINLDKNGNLYFCSLIQNIHLLEQYFNIRFNKIEGKYGDFVNIHKINDINDILYGINNKIPFCDYCIDYPESNIVEWKQSERKLDEWCLI